MIVSELESETALGPSTFGLGQPGLNRLWHEMTQPPRRLLAELRTTGFHVATLSTPAAATVAPGAANPELTENSTPNTALSLDGRR